MARQDLGKIISEITEINATVDNGVGVPSATATITGTATEKIVNIDFKNLKGDKGDKPENGVDYFTPEEKKQFTAETVKLVTDEGTKQTGLVGEKGVAETGKLTAEGNKQINLVIAEANKVIEQLKSLIEGNPETSNAQTLSGKSRVEFERDTQALAGKYVGNFPLTAAVKDAVYLVPATGKFYMCTTAYNGTNLTAPNANFEELSVYKNRDKLENLFNNKRVGQFFINENITSQQSIELVNLTNIDGLVLLNIPYSYIGDTGSDEISLLVNDKNIAYLPSKETAREHFYCATVSFNKHKGDVVKIKTNIGTLKFEQLNITYIVF